MEWRDPHGYLVLDVDQHQDRVVSRLGETYINCPKCKTSVPINAISACLLNVLVGCSGSHGSSGPEASNAKLGAGAANQSSAACEAQRLTSKDVAGILVAPIIGTKTVSGDVQSCEYSTGGFPAIIISVRPGLGKSSVDAWIAGRMPLKASPLPGVGEAAAWQASLHEVIAEKRNLLCDVKLLGGASDIAISVDSLPGALGALCDRVFASG